MSRSRVLLATRSAGKLRELRPLFAAAGFDAVDLADIGLAESAEEVSLERFATFEENARAKAHYFHERSGGMPTVADDSGLEVLALGGRPGVWSKRWSGRIDLAGQALDDANNAKLIAELRGIADRRARYVCVACYVDGARELSRRGEVAGTMTDQPSGTGGFGYDPYFVSAELGGSFGDLTREQKEEISHRGRAFRALLAALRSVSSPS